MDNDQSPATKGRGPFGLPMEVGIAILVCLVAVAAIVGSRKFPGTGLSTDIGSARFPLIYSVALIVLSVVLVVQSLRKGPPTAASAPAADKALADADAETPSPWRPVAGMAATVALLAAIPVLGYGLVTVLYLSFLMALLGMRHRLWNPLLALAITVVMYFTFSAGLGVPLPMGSLFE